MVGKHELNALEHVVRHHTGGACGRRRRATRGAVEPNPDPAPIATHGAQLQTAAIVTSSANDVGSAHSAVGLGPARR